VHYDEAFSSLQVPHFKGFCRFHVTKAGDLEMFGLALEKVPQAWREDPRWRTPQGGGNRDAPAHRAKFPSRWGGGLGGVGWGVGFREACLAGSKAQGGVCPLLGLPAYR
jgi:hypothetical protein